MDKLFAKFANATARVTGSPQAFLACIAAVLIWAASGPLFRFSETWQLVINTGTTIVTFLMVFLIQNTQNRDGLAIQTKLDELIRASDAEGRVHGHRETDRQAVGRAARQVPAHVGQLAAACSTRPRRNARRAWRRSGRPRRRLRASRA